MSLPITFRPEARAELVEAWSWYEEQRADRLLRLALDVDVEDAVAAGGDLPREEVSRRHDARQVKDQLC